MTLLYSSPAGPGNFSHQIPRDLTARAQWVAWRTERDRRGKPTKVPYNARTHRRASSTNPTTWSTFPEACAAVPPFAGIGFVVTAGDPVTGGDLDHCVDPQTRVIAPWAWEIVEPLNTYTEYSPSGTGLRSFAHGVLPPGRRKRGPVEVYDRARYFTVTGEHLAGTPWTIEPRQDALTALHARIRRAIDDTIISAIAIEHHSLARRLRAPRAHPVLPCRGEALRRIVARRQDRLRVAQ